MIKRFGIAIILSSAICITGCGEKTLVFNEPTIVVSKKGVISQTIVDSFSEDYYNIDELKNEFNVEIDAFNKENGDNSVVLNDLHQENGEVFASLDFLSWEKAKSFNNEDIFFGSINDAYDNGHSLDINLKGIEDGALIGKNELMGMSGNHILIIPNSGIVKVPYKISYVSAGIEIIDDKSVRVSSDSDGLAYIVMK